MNALVSIVIPCHNHARYLRRAVESVVAQTHRPIEIVIVNDGSSDNTSDVARAILADYAGERMRLIEQERQGAPRARNAGARASSGEYLMLLDVDDTIEPKMVEATATVMDAEPDVAIVYTYTTHRCDRDNPPPGGVFDDYVQEYPEYDFAHWLRHNPQLDSCALVRRNAFDETGGLDPAQFAEDLDLWIGITKRGWRAKLVPRPLFNYWHHGGSRESDESWMRPIDLRWQLIHKHPDLFDERERLFVGSLMLASAAADLVDLCETIVSSGESGLDWITVTSRTNRLASTFLDHLSDCDRISGAKSSEALAAAISELLSASRRAAAVLSRLVEACSARNLPEAVDLADQLSAMLPRIGEEMVRVYRAGMAEVYGPSPEKDLRLH